MEEHGLADEKSAMGVASINLSIVAELLGESLPQLVIIVLNTKMSGEPPTFAFYFSTFTSGLAIINSRPCVNLTSCFPEKENNR